MMSRGFPNDRYVRKRASWLRRRSSRESGGGRGGRLTIQSSSIARTWAAVSSGTWTMALK